MHGLYFTGKIANLFQLLGPAPDWYDDAYLLGREGRFNRLYGRYQVAVAGDNIRRIPDVHYRGLEHGDGYVDIGSLFRKCLVGLMADAAGLVHPSERPEYHLYAGGLQRPDINLVPV